MSFVLQTAAHTPPYVFALLAFLIWQGLLALRTRTQPVWAVVAAPAAFAAFGLALVVRGRHDLAVLAAWLAAAACGAALGLATAPRLLGAEPGRSAVTRAGSAVPLLRNLCVFALQYAVALAQALHLAAPATTALAATLVSGASVGYAAGWGLGFRSRYRRIAVARVGRPRTTV